MIGDPRGAQGGSDFDTLADIDDPCKAALNSVTVRLGSYGIKGIHVRFLSLLLGIGLIS
jgi:hypothetical protein